MSPTSTDSNIIQIKDGRVKLAAKRSERLYGHLSLHERCLALFELLRECDEREHQRFINSGRPYVEIVKSDEHFVFTVFRGILPLAEIPLCWGSHREEIKGWLSKPGGREVDVPWVELNMAKRKHPFYAEIDTSTVYWKILSNIEMRQGSRDLSRAAVKERGSAVRRQILEKRSVDVEVRRGEFEGKGGYFTTYSKGEKEVCTFFTRHFDKYGVKSLLDYGEKKETRMPWKMIDSGELFRFQAPLSIDAIRLIENPGRRLKNLIYVDTSVLGRDFFEETESEEIKRKVIYFARQG